MAHRSLSPSLMAENSKSMSLLEAGKSDKAAWHDANIFFKRTPVNMAAQVRAACIQTMPSKFLTPRQMTGSS